MWIGECSPGDAKLLTAQVESCGPAFFTGLTSATLPPTTEVTASLKDRVCTDEARGCFCNPQGPNNITFVAEDDCTIYTALVRLTKLGMWAYPRPGCESFADECKCVANACSFMCEDVSEKSCLEQMKGTKVAAEEEAEGAEGSGGGGRAADAHGEREGSGTTSNSGDGGDKDIWRWLGPVLGIVGAVIGATGAVIAAMIGHRRQQRKDAEEAHQGGDRQLTDAVTAAPPASAW